MLNEVYGALALPRVAKEAGTDHLRFPFIPPLPTVLHRLGLPDDQPEFAVADRNWSREAYCRGSLAYYARVLRSDLVRSFVQSRGDEFLAAFQGVPALSEQPHGDLLPSSTEEFAEELVLAAFWVLLKRQASPGEVDAHVTNLRTTGLRHWLGAVAHSLEFERAFGLAERPLS